VPVFSERVERKGDYSPKKRRKLKVRLSRKDYTQSGDVERKKEPSQRERRGESSSSAGKRED